jgi:hypothetical protein
VIYIHILLARLLEAYSNHSRHFHLSRRIQIHHHTGITQFPCWSRTQRPTFLSTKQQTSLSQQSIAQQSLSLSPGFTLSPCLVLRSSTQKCGYKRTHPNFIACTPILFSQRQQLSVDSMITNIFASSRSQYETCMNFSSQTPNETKK